MQDYEAFLSRKLVRPPPTGLADIPVQLDTDPHLFPFQRDLVRWTLRRGRCALFASTGLGKSRQELTWAFWVHVKTGADVLILTPLAVAKQMEREAEAIGIKAKVCRDGSEVEPGITITNYERLHRFDTTRFGGVACDEASVLKHENSKTFTTLCEIFKDTPFRLTATATPAPNDYVELGTQAEFLGICTQSEMLAEWFVHDGGDTSTWRLKRHARKPFWRWVASWAALLRKPSDLGYDDGGYDLPPLHIEQHTVAADEATTKAQGFLFAMPAITLVEQRVARKASVDARVIACADLARSERSEQWVIWSNLNAEQDALADELGDEAVSIYGSLDADEKERRHEEWLAGKRRILLSKCSIFGWGLNWQHCARMAFVGVDHSWESQHQAIRRIWRFGQKRKVKIHIFASEAEGNIVKNLERKQRDADSMADELSAETRDVVRAEICGQKRSRVDYEPTVGIELPPWLRGSESSEEAAA